MVEVSRSKSDSKGRATLSADAILDACHEIIQRGGLDALSMPALGRELGAGVTSIYWYFRSKEELLIALAERVTAALFDGLPEVENGPWQQVLEDYFDALRTALRSNSADAELLAAYPRSMLVRPGISVVIAQRVEQELALLTALGVPPGEAAQLYTACWSYTQGWVILARAQLGDSEETSERELRTTASRLLPADFPVLSDARSLLDVTVVNEDVFRNGLRAIIGGIGVKMLVDAGPPKPVRAARRRSSNGS